MLVALTLLSQSANDLCVCVCRNMPGHDDLFVIGCDNLCLDPDLESETQTPSRVLTLVA